MKIPYQNLLLATGNQFIQLHKDIRLRHLIEILLFEKITTNM